MPAMNTSADGMVLLVLNAGAGRTRPYRMGPTSANPIMNGPRLVGVGTGVGASHYIWRRHVDLAGQSSALTAVAQSLPGWRWRFRWQVAALGDAMPAESAFQSSGNARAIRYWGAGDDPGS